MRHAARAMPHHTVIWVRVVGVLQREMRGGGAAYNTRRARTTRDVSDRALTTHRRARGTMGGATLLAATSLYPTIRCATRTHVRTRTLPPCGTPSAGKYPPFPRSSGVRASGCVRHTSHAGHDSNTKSAARPRACDDATARWNPVSQQRVKQHRRSRSVVSQVTGHRSHRCTGAVSRARRTDALVSVGPAPNPTRICVRVCVRVCLRVHLLIVHV